MIVFQDIYKNNKSFYFLKWWPQKRWLESLWCKDHTDVLTCWWRHYLRTCWKGQLLGVPAIHQRVMSIHPLPFMQESPSGQNQKMKWYETLLWKPANCFLTYFRNKINGSFIFILTFNNIVARILLTFILIKSYKFWSLVFLII